MSKTETNTKTYPRTFNEAALKKTVKDQSDRISNLVMTVSSLTDEVADLKNDISRLRENVSEDLKDLYAQANSKLNR